MTDAAAQAAEAPRRAVLRRPSTLYRRVQRTVSFLAVAGILAAAWWWLAPPQLGGSTTVLVTDGTSMLPDIEPTGLVALRPSSTYEVGDVVGYHSEMLNRIVLHRIVAIENGRYVFKGDNNTFRDPERSPRSEIVGKLWFHLGSAGRLINVIHTPWTAAALAGLLVLGAGLGRTKNQ